MGFTKPFRIGCGIGLLALVAACGDNSPANSSAADAPDDAVTTPKGAGDAAPAKTASAPVVQSSDPGYPALPAQSADAQGFVPAGWALEKTLTGDLNADGSPDIVMVMREADDAKMLPIGDDRGERSFNSNPYRLAVAFKQSGDGGYTLAAENHDIIPRHENREIVDPFGEITMGKGTFTLVLSHFANVGSYFAETRKLHFRYQQGAFRLIGFDNIETQRSTGEVTSTSANYLTGKMKIGKGSIESDEEAVTWKTLPQRPLRTMADVGDGMEFKP